MEYDDYLDAMKEGIYDKLPKTSETWGVDVWERVFRPRVASGQKKELFRRHEMQLQTDMGQKVMDAMRLDLFGIRPDGKKLHGVPDAMDASHRVLVPDLDATIPEEAREAVYLLLVQSSYKLHKWGSVTQLKEFADLCETAPRIHIPGYLTAIEGAVDISAQAAAVMHCDIETKPNFANMPSRVRLLRSVSNVAERMYELLLKGGE